MPNRIWIWISAHRNFSIGLGAIMFVVLLYMLTIGSCSSSPAASSPAPGGGYFFWKLLLAGLIVAAVVCRERPYLALTFSGLAVLVFLVLLGKFDGLFTWGILGLPIFAAAGIYGARHTENQAAKNFLYATSFALIGLWGLMLYKSHQSLFSGIEPDFLKEMLQENPKGEGAAKYIAKILFSLTLLFFALGWLFSSRKMYAISLFVFLAFLGNEVINPMFGRFPDKLSLSNETKSAYKEIRNGVLDRAKEAVKPGATAPSTPAPSTPLPEKKESRRSVEKRVLVFQCRDTDGSLNFRVDELPWYENGRYLVVYRLVQDKPGKLFLKVNGRTGDEGRDFSYDHRLAGQEATVVFFEDAPGGFQGKPEYFTPGTNWIKIRPTPGIKVKVIYAEIFIESWA